MLLAQESDLPEAFLLPCIVGLTLGALQEAELAAERMMGGGGLGGGGGGSPKSDWRERGITWITPSSMEGVPKIKHSRRHAWMPQWQWATPRRTATGRERRTNAYFTRMVSVMR